MKRLLVVCLAAFSFCLVGVRSAKASETEFGISGSGTLGGSNAVSYNITLTAILDTNGNTGVGVTLPGPTYDVIGATGTITENGVVFTVIGVPDQTTGSSVVNGTTYNVSGDPTTLGLGNSNTLQNVPNSGGANLTFDNLVSAGSPYLDFDGLALLTSSPDGNSAVNLYYDPNNGLYYYGNYNYDNYPATLYANSEYGEIVSLALVTPEPASMLLFGTGLLAMGLVTRKKLLA